MSKITEKVAEVVKPIVEGLGIEPIRTGKIDFGSVAGGE